MNGEIDSYSLRERERDKQKQVPGGARPAPLAAAGPGGPRRGLLGLGSSARSCSGSSPRRCAWSPSAGGVRRRHGRPHADGGREGGPRRRGRRSGAQRCRHSRHDGAWRHTGGRQRGPRRRHGRRQGALHGRRGRREAFGGRPGPRGLRGARGAGRRPGGLRGSGAGPDNDSGAPGDVIICINTYLFIIMNGYDYIYDSLFTIILKYYYRNYYNCIPGAMAQAPPRVAAAAAGQPGTAATAKSLVIYLVNKKSTKRNHGLF